jgi:hypothetical protein
MKSSLLISMTALTVACGTSPQPHSDSSAPTTSAVSQPNATDASGATSPGQTKDGRVTLVGCLQGPSLPGATGTAGSAAGERGRARAAGSESDATPRHGAASTGTYVLANAAVEASAVGANGAGGSGGPLVSGGSSFELDGLPADAVANVNKRVRITGQVDTRPAATRSTSGTARTGAPASNTTGGTSTNDDVRANSTAVAGDSTNRLLTVESVQVVAERCGPQ